uniref:Casein kinase II subunit beta n=1 Tax=Panagrolaimus superbus TaxID=310955 RepID=A0A914Z3V5_9BILA
MSESMTSDSDESAYEYLDWFHSLKTTKFMCRIDEYFLEDAFNRTNLEKELLFAISENTVAKFIRHIKYDTSVSGYDLDEIEEIAADVYGLMHARYILSSAGLKDMKKKYERGEFGHCPRDKCNEQKVLPIGETELGEGFVNIFCPKCREIYFTKSKFQLDGAYFGPSFPTAFLMEFPEILLTPHSTIKPSPECITTSDSSESSSERSSSIKSVASF